VPVPLVGILEDSSLQKPGLVLYEQEVDWPSTLGKWPLQRLQKPSLQDGGSEHDRGKDRGRDLLIVEEDEDSPDGTVVVALVRDGEEVTVKNLYREGAR
jgi:hypothetical protein